MVQLNPVPVFGVKKKTVPFNRIFFPEVSVQMVSAQGSHFHMITDLNHLNVYPCAMQKAVHHLGNTVRSSQLIQPGIETVKSSPQTGAWQSELTKPMLLPILPL